jgi:hypothetical protein
VRHAALVATPVVAHAAAVVATAVALHFFLTPAEMISTVPDQTVRYATYALAFCLIALSAGTVLGLLVIGTSWLPVAYLWSVPFAIVLLPSVSPSAAHFIYVGMTSRIGGLLAIAGMIAWVLGLSAGALAIVALSRYRH